VFFLLIISKLKPSTSSSQYGHFIESPLYELQLPLQVFF
jgi:hypothetical protein